MNGEENARRGSKAPSGVEGPPPKESKPRLRPAVEARTTIRFTARDYARYREIFEECGLPMARAVAMAASYVAEAVADGRLSISRGGISERRRN